ncbi:uncharacterized protein BT62DRAFT_1013380 [Guyanagaster necrorhizus]|uniref:Uncharacterized protein n=1 Tax=Guyanagaster necrorhizus TaxID=856835 RepID=A0A9P7VFY8_9AGAR|nr:uncharacterized protein BT62DRAFT_1013380 [Guyanagaster necrorhizus MCA 3950]KAG7439840.1 hypothetical protein BT62DRAFT_1013380 [Guyanagaster necrorhizus MCA 3950]
MGRAKEEAISLHDEPQCDRFNGESRRAPQNPLDAGRKLIRPINEIHGPKQSPYSSRRSSRAVKDYRYISTVGIASSSTDPIYRDQHVTIPVTDASEQPNMLSVMIMFGTATLRTEGEHDVYVDIKRHLDWDNTELLYAASETLEEDKLG